MNLDSLDFMNYWLPQKFGFDKKLISSLILTGQMKREEALERLKKPEMKNDFLKTI